MSHGLARHGAVFAELLPGASGADALIARGVVPATEGPRSGPVLRRTDGGVPGDLAPGDHVLLPFAGWSAAVAAVRARGGVPWVVVGTPSEIAAVDGAGLWLRGLESGGSSAGFGAVVLIRAVHRKATLPPFVVEGLGVRASAAALAVGAAGLVVGAPLWTATDSPLGDAVRKLLAGRPTARDAVVVGEIVDRHVRVLSRGASPAVAALKDAELRGDAEGFDRVVRDGLVDWWTRGDGLVPAPQSIADLRTGSSADVVAAFLADVGEHLALVHGHHPLRAGQDPLGTGAPVVQGPMANVAERPELGRAVGRAGGMPFFALGALDDERAREVLDGARSVGGPWGVGVIGFDVSPHRDSHLALVKAARAREGGPAAVILAGGTPELAAKLEQDGVPAWLHTPSGRLAAHALRQGVRAVVFEGHEAGGHVGALTSAGLWEEGLEAVEAARRERPDDPEPLVVLAGGVGDAASAAFAAAMAAKAASLGAKIVLQAGTAFFFTHEIAESGQLSPVCQRIALGCDRTVLVGSTVHLPLRCAPNAWTSEAREEERLSARSGATLGDRRLRMESAAVGRTRVAARWIERNPDRASDPAAPRYRPVPPERQAVEGAHTMGQGAAVTREVSTVAEVVRALSVDAAALLDAVAARREATPPADERFGPARPVDLDPPSAGPIVEPALESLRPLAERASGAASDVRQAEPIAVVGLGCVLPRAADVPTYWANLVSGVDAIDEIPHDRWLPDRYWDPSAGPRGPARSRSRVAGAVGEYAFDPRQFRIPPRVVATMDPAQRLALAAAAEALAVAPKVDGERAAVLLGNSMGGEFAKSLAVRVRWREALAILKEDPALSGVGAATWDEIERRVDAGLGETLPPLNGNSMAGALANVIAGRVASWLDWYGGNFTVDAACASSLAAVSIAVDWLRSGRCDVALTGGVDTDLSPETFVGFSLTGALSSAGSRPFAEGADGFVMGEGCGVLVLKRLSDALRDGDPVWATIRGVGQSSDGKGRGITAPRAEGQRLALARAYADAGVDPRTVGLVEAHGTGTTIGDRTETAVLREAFDGGAAWLGSVKSMLGHLKGAAGAAGLVKAVLSVATGVVPPTLHAGPVEPALRLAGGPFRLPKAATTWAGSPRRAGVSAFGFGGTNFHVVLEQAPAGARVPALLPALADVARPHLVAPEDAAWPLPDGTPSVEEPEDVVPVEVAPPAALVPSPASPLPAPAPSRRIVAWAAEDEAGLVAAIEADDAVPVDVAARRPHRVVAVVGEDRQAVRRSALAVASGANAPGLWRGRGAPSTVAALVPGQGTQRLGAVDAVRRLPAAAALIDELERQLPDVLRGVAANDLFPRFAALEVGADGGVATDTLALHLLMYAVTVAWGRALADAGVPIGATLGHSLGEYAALAIAGRLDVADGLRLVAARGAALRAMPEGRMVAAQVTGAEAAILADRHGVALAAVNGPRSVVLSGPEGAVEAVRRELGSRGAPAVPLPVARAFHSPAVAPASEALAAALAGVRFTPGATVWSGRTAAPFGPDPREDLVAALVEPVRFADAVAGLGRAYGLLVEVGPGQALSRHAQAAGSATVALDPQPGDDGAGLVAAGAALAAAGHPGLAMRLPAGSVEVPRGTKPAALRTAVSPAKTSPMSPRTSPVDDPALVARARVVQDLRIAAIADPSMAEEYERARASLLRELALRDLGLIAAGEAAGGHDEGGVGASGLAGPSLPPVGASGLAGPSLPPVGASGLAGPSLPPGRAAGEAAGGHEDGPSSTRDAVLAAIAEVTGYTADAIAPGADLEGDLGIDSIRKMEILGLLQERLGFEAAEADYARLARADLEGLVAFVDEKVTGPAAPAPAPSPKAQGPSAQAIRLYAPVLEAVPAAAPAEPLQVGFQVRGRKLVWRSPPPSADVPGDARAAALQLLAEARRLPSVDGLVVVAEGPAALAAAGFARSLGAEKGLPVRVVRVEGADPRQVAGEAASDRDVVVREDGTFAERFVPAAPVAASLPDRPVVVATGGGHGIVAACLRALAPLRPRIALLARREPGPALRGLDVRFVRCDVRDGDAVRRAVADVRETFGRVDVVVHGAGVLRDKTVDRLTDADVADVLGPKLDGAAALMAATPDLGLWVAFSSLAAEGGNPGQAAYGAANAVLDGWRHPTARSLSIGWSAWSEVGMAAAPALQRFLKARGVVPIAPEAGAAAFRDVLGREGRVLVAAHDLPDVRPLPWPLTAAIDATSARVELDPKDPALADHAVGGRALVPAATWVAAFTAIGVHHLDGFEVLAPTFVTSARHAVVSSADLTVTVDGEVVARARRGRPLPAPSLVAGGPSRPVPYRPDALFHGPRWRVLGDVRGNGDVASGTLLRADVASAVDAAHQLLALLSAVGGQLALPVGGSWSLVGEPVAGSVVTASSTGDVVVGKDGVPWLVGKDVRGKPAARWPAGVPHPLRADG